MFNTLRVLAVLCMGLVFVGCNGEVGAKPPVGGNGIGGYKAVVYDHTSEMFLAVGTGGRMDAICIDSTVRARVIVPTNEDLLCIFADEDIVLVGGTGGVIFYSEGETFRRAETGVTTAILGLTAFGGRYFASGEDGVLLSSDDGKEWRIQRFAGNKDIIAIAALEERIMAITAESVFYVSEDGVNWAYQDFNDFHYGFYEPLVFKGIEAIDTMFYVFGYFEGSPDAPFIMRTFDGNIWVFVPITEINLDAIERYIGNDDMPIVAINAIATDYMQILAACDGGYVLTLDNCDTCHKMTDVLDVDLQGIAFGNGRFLVVGDDFKFDVLEAIPGAAFEIGAERALEYIQGGALIIDVRPEAEAARRRVRGSINIPLDQVVTVLPNEAPDSNSRLIFYCDDGESAQMALEIAVNLGYRRVHNLGGFSSGWPFEIE